MIHERWNILASRPQRRQAHADHVQPVVEVLADSSVRDGPVEVAVRRRDDADVDRMRLRRADRTHLHLL